MFISVDHLITSSNHFSEKFGAFEENPLQTLLIKSKNYFVVCSTDFLF